MTQKMYLGPTVPGLVKENEIFRDELPDGIARRVETDKNFARLFVPMDRIMDARRQLQTEGSVLSAAYSGVAKGL